MLYLILTLFAGIIFGIALRKQGKRFHEERSLTLPLILLIFFMGASIGANPDVAESASVIGYQSVIFAVLTVFGSALAAILFRRVFRD